MYKFEGYDISDKTTASDDCQLIVHWDSKFPVE